MFQNWQSPASASSFVQDVKNVSTTGRSGLGQAQVELGAAPQLIF
jgi:hypothetical protein